MGQLGVRVRDVGLMGLGLELLKRSVLGFAEDDDDWMSAETRGLKELLLMLFIVLFFFFSPVDLLVLGSYLNILTGSVFKLVLITG